MDVAICIAESRVSGVSRFGAFVSLMETGADGILPMRHLPQDFYDHDEKGHRLVGRRRRLEIRVGDMIDVRLVASDEVAGSIVFEYAQGLEPSDRGRDDHDQNRGRPLRNRGNDRDRAPKGRKKVKTRKRR